MVLEIEKLVEQASNFRGPEAPSFDVIRSCVHCGLCLPACPTYRITGRERSSPRGRIWLMKQVATGEVELADPIFQKEMALCLNCRACEAVCPSGVQYGQILEASRAQLEKNIPASPKKRLLRAAGFDLLFRDMRVFRAVNNGLKLYQRTLLRSAARKSGVLRLLGMDDAERLMPSLSDDFVVPRGETYPALGERRGRVGLFTGCVMSTAYAPVHQATIRVLRRNGYDVTLLADQTCCGALHVHAGDPEGGRRLARRNIEAFDNPNLDAVIVNAAGCGAQLKEYGHLLARDEEYTARAAAFAAKVTDVTEFLAGVGLSEQPGPLPLTVTYQEPCHLAHAQRVTKQPRSLLAAIPGLRLVEMPESSLCCGSAGIYNLMQPEMSGQLLARKLDNALSTEAELIVSANPGCMLQLSAGLQARGIELPVVHLIELLDRAYQVKSTRPLIEQAAD